MNKKERTFESESLTLENCGIYSRKGQSDNEVFESHSHDPQLEPLRKSHRFPFSRDLILRLIKRLESK